MLLTSICCCCLIRWNGAKTHAGLAFHLLIRTQRWNSQTLAGIEARSSEPNPDTFITEAVSLTCWEVLFSNISTPQSFTRFKTVRSQAVRFTAKLYCGCYKLHVVFSVFVCFFLGAGPESDPNLATSWSRPPLPKPVDPGKDSVIFQQTDIDHYIGKGFAKASDSLICLVLLLYVTTLQNSFS